MFTAQNIINSARMYFSSQEGLNQEFSLQEYQKREISDSLGQLIDIEKHSVSNTYTLLC